METDNATYTQIWDRVLIWIKPNLNDDSVYATFFQGSYIDRIEGNTIYAVANTGLAKEVLSKNYGELVSSAVLKTTGTNFKVIFMSEEERSQKAKIQEEEPVFFPDSRLNPNYTFANFVVGASNREAYQAALMIARNPGKLYSPLLIYSDSGLGKTHLLHAIGNSIHENKPNLNVLYTSAADFVDEYVRYARGDKDKDGNSLVSYFSKSVDVFLVDDIQFLVGKKGTMESFFVVFSKLYEQGKQIVITSDQHPNRLDGLDQRLKTRFIQGLTLAIIPPDLPTSEEILRSRIAQSGLNADDFDPDVFTFLAQHFSSSVRELEEALNRLLFYTVSICQVKHVTLDVAKDAVSGLLKEQGNQGKLCEARIISTVADYYNLSPSQLTGKIRTSQIALARHIAMYLMRTLMDDQYAKIGEAMGGRDHATVMSAVQKVEKSLKDDELLQKAISELTLRLTK